MKKTLCFAVVIAMLFLFAACTHSEEPQNLWDTAIYTEDATVGEGAKSFTLSVTCEEKSITLTVNTDADNLGAALYELGLVGDAVFTDTVNGIVADWDAYNAYWAIYVGEGYASVGISELEISGGEVFAFVYTVM